MDSKTNNEAPRAGGPGETEQFAGAAGRVEQPGDIAHSGGANTTYIPPEVRPTGASTPYDTSGEPTRHWSQPSAASGPAPAPMPPPNGYAQQQPHGWERRDRRPHAPVLGPVLLIGAGVIFLLNNLNVLPWSIWGQLWRLWPLILIAIGLDLLLGRRNPLVSLLVVLVVLAAGIGIVFSYGGLQSPGNVTQSALSVPLNSAKSADVRIEMGVGQLNVDGNMSGSSNLLATGTLGYYQNNKQPEQAISTNGDTIHLNLVQRDDNVNFIPFFGKDKDHLDWNIHLNPGAPTSLDVQTGAGNSTLDLEKLKVTELNVERGIGNVEVTLPAEAGSSSVTVQSGVGNARIVVPGGVAARITVHSGIGKVNVGDGFTKVDDRTYQSLDYSSSAKNKLDLDIEAGIGNVNVATK
jgi:hypothetical protein